MPVSTCRLVYRSFISWPGPGSDHSSRSRFQCTTSQPPVPRPNSTAVVLTTTRSPTATAPISWVRTYAGRPSTSTRCNPGRSESSAVTVPVLYEGTSLERRDQLLDALVTGLEGVLAQDRALGLVVELQVDPVDGVIALALLGPADELATKAGTRRLGRLDDGRVD